MPKYLRLILTRCALVIVACAAYFSCSSRSSRSSQTFFERQALEPASDADEWIVRLEQDLGKAGYGSGFLGTLYSELPTIDQWPAVCDELDKLVKDEDRVTKLIEGGMLQHRGADRICGKLLLFSAMLRDEDADHEPEFRKLIEANGDSAQVGTNAANGMLMLSKDRAATTNWLNGHSQTTRSSGSASHSRTESKKSDWEIALAENRVDDGIRLLEDAARKEQDTNEKSGFYERLIRIALVLDRMPLAREATEKLTEITFKSLGNGDRGLEYYYTAILDVPSLEEDWASIAKTCEEIKTLRDKVKPDPHQFDYGPGRSFLATYLTALHRLNRTADFDAGIEKLQAASAENPADFFYLLKQSARGQPPLGVLFLDSLKAAGRDEESILYAHHMLARDGGNDAYYAQLLKIDPAGAAKFIESLHAYDPYEERPLIWLAEIARKAGDLPLAEKTIDQAIALDPSDGDHGKDDRMFCYEVLARIHQDAGRLEKAEFFRSVVESIRQGEAADDFLYVGLIREAADRYAKALGKFEDAYCLQSRLAMTLARNGRFDESVDHFRKAFTLMPVSFGPRESHCFGCEGLFDDPRVIEIALPILKELEKDSPKNARTPYLLGLIFLEMNEEKQAQFAFQRALELDPKYYNAAKRLLALLEKDIENFTAVEELKKSMFEFAPYSEKADFIPKQAKLRTYWQVCGEFPVCPLNLADLPFLPKPALETKQYIETERTEGFIQSSWETSQETALQGWNPSKLRKKNLFLVVLDGMY